MGTTYSPELGEAFLSSFSLPCHCLELISCTGTPSFAILIAGARISDIDNLEEPNSEWVFSQPAAAPGTVTELRLTSGIWWDLIS
jgi:hypothetical protein